MGRNQLVNTIGRGQRMAAAPGGRRDKRVHPGDYATGQPLHPGGGRRCRARYDFAPEDGPLSVPRNKQLGFRRGDVLVVNTMAPERDDGMVVAQDKQGRLGYVPIDFMEPVEDLDVFPRPEGNGHDHGLLNNSRNSNSYRNNNSMQELLGGIERPVSAAGGVSLGHVRPAWGPSTGAGTRAAPAPVGSGRSSPSVGASTPSPALDNSPHHQQAGAATRAPQPVADITPVPAPVRAARGDDVPMRAVVRTPAGPPALSRDEVDEAIDKPRPPKFRNSGNNVFRRMRKSLARRHDGNEYKFN